MKKSYLTTAFQKTAKNYPAQTETHECGRLMQDYRSCAGKTPMLPRKSSGIWKPDPAGYRGI